MRVPALNFEKKHFILGCLLLFTLAIYIQVLWYGPISWDDPEMVFANRAVKDLSAGDLLSNYYVGNYIPVTMLVHSLSYQLFGPGFGGHHAINILFHLINGILIYVLSKRIFRNDPVALITAAVFLLHPLQVESVAWISELKTVLSATFFLGGLITYTRFADSKNISEYVLTILLFVLASLSKPSAVIFPVCLLCLQLFLKRRFEWKNAGTLIPFFLLALVFGLINLKAQSAGQFINYSHQYPLYQKVFLAGIALLKYTQLFILPLRLSALYPYPAIVPINLAGGFIVLLVLGGLVFFLLKRKHFVFSFVIFFILTNLLLVLQLIPFGEVLYADRYMYMPVAGFAWLLALALHKFKLPYKLSGAIIVIIITAFTLYRIPVWTSGITVYEDIIKKYPGQFVALNSAGVESMRLNKDQKALDYFDRAVKAAPRNYKGFYNAGLLFLKLKEPEQAIKRFNASLALYEYSKAYSGRASAYLMLGKTDIALQDARKAVELDNTNPNGWFVLGNGFSEKQQLQEALSAYNHAMSINPEQPDYYFRRAIVYGKIKKFSSSLADLEKCTQINPYYIEAYYWKGVAKVNLSQNPCDDFKIAARNNYEPAISAFKKFCR